ncbi:hypothetical protein LIER_40241 [Lithospermum erythrorhizon]|uniref:Uncharacterized protein n=1 Tax=Lithospermum erythrorhizon TaxID=34254 RepID=A0AAV3QTY6_LITER
MAGGVQICPPPHLEVMASPPLKFSFDGSLPSLPQVQGYIHNLQDPSTAMLIIPLRMERYLLSSPLWFRQVLVLSRLNLAILLLTLKSSKVTGWSRRFRPLTRQLYV